MWPNAVLSPQTMPQRHLTMRRHSMYIKTGTVGNRRRSLLSSTLTMVYFSASNNPFIPFLQNGIAALAMYRQCTENKIVGVACPKCKSQRIFLAHAPQIGSRIYFRYQRPSVTCEQQAERTPVGGRAGQMDGAANKMTRVNARESEEGSERVKFASSVFPSLGDTDGVRCLVYNSPNNTTPTPPRTCSASNLGSGANSPYERSPLGSAANSNVELATMPYAGRGDGGGDPREVRFGGRGRSAGYRYLSAGTPPLVWVLESMGIGGAEMWQEDGRGRGGEKWG
ncbi:hypothetical protein B0H14DRAFT_3173382 [Mycena olivaceomarginata]|nr:hypothetical protein B0H14DRAFT_3173382 [Mycena olivaceomarginata]